MGRRFNKDWERIIPTYTQVLRKTRSQEQAVQKAFDGVDWEKFEEAWKYWVEKYMK